jgi:multiple sugar transport system ATP-binding protein
MPLGDRVVVMRAGVVQQVGPPQDLYDHPDNIFVAGFIGSPSMNFVPATIENSALRSPLGEFSLPGRMRQQLERAPGGPREVILGIRPEHFEDADLLDESDRLLGATFTGTVEVVDFMSVERYSHVTGSDKYAYFSLAGSRARSAELEELAADSGAAEVPGATDQLTARLSAASKATKGATMTAWFDLSRAHIFDVETGHNLTSGLTE